MYTLIYLKKMELRKAQEQFVRGRVDPREVISLFPRMLPSSSNFTRAIPSLHDIADINQVNLKQKRYFFQRSDIFFFLKMHIILVLCSFVLNLIELNFPWAFLGQ